jgi:hypothetical protein
LVIFGVVFWVKSAVLGGPYVGLGYEPFYAPVSRVLESSYYPSYVPVEGKDYTITNVHYFNKQTWVLLSLQPVSTMFNPGIVVLHRASGSYVVVLGPDSSFHGVNLESLPPVVVNYIRGG